MWTPLGGRDCRSMSMSPSTACLVLVSMYQMYYCECSVCYTCQHPILLPADLSIDAMDVSGEQQFDVMHNIVKQRLSSDGSVVQEKKLESKQSGCMYVRMCACLCVLLPIPLSTHVCVCTRVFHWFLNMSCKQMHVHNCPWQCLLRRGGDPGQSCSG